MPLKKKNIVTTHQAKLSYIPKIRGKLRTWAANLDTQIGTEGATLGLSTSQVSNLQTELTDYINAENALDAAKLAVKAASANAKSTKKAMIAGVRPSVGLMKKSSAYTQAIGETMGIEGVTHEVALATYQPKLGKTNLENNLVHIGFVKGAAETMNVYGRLKGAADFTLIGSKIKYTPFIDNRMLAVAGVAEVREYKLHGVYGDHEIGMDSEIVTIPYGGGTIGSNTGGIIGGNTPAVEG